MGKLITSHEVPSFIITLGGLLVFKGLFWLVIRNQTVNASKGGEENIMSMLTTFSFSGVASFVILAVICFSLFVFMQKRRKTQQEYDLRRRLLRRAILKPLSFVRHFCL